MSTLKKSQTGVLATMTLSIGITMLAVPAQASNLTITPIFDSSITSLGYANGVKSIINHAIATIESDVTTINPVNVKISFENYPYGLGYNVSPTGNLSYSSFAADLRANPGQTTIQSKAYASLPVGTNSGVNNAKVMDITAANLAAIGETSLANSIVAANGGINSTVYLDLPVMTANNYLGAYDLTSVALHEIDEVLGIGGQGSTLLLPDSTNPSSLPADIGSMDLFRYSAPGVRSFTYDANVVSYFSIDGGMTKLITFNQQNGGDYGDWSIPPLTQSGTAPWSVQDAFLYPYTQLNLSRYELMALNVIGYNLTPAGMAIVGVTSVPIPSATLLMWSGLLGLLGLSLFKSAEQ